MKVAGSRNRARQSLGASWLADHGSRPRNAGQGLRPRKQIGERLYLSPRTVAAHLRQVFPKLGVTTRAALRDALAGHQMSQPAAVAALITQAMAATRG